MHDCRLPAIETVSDNLIYWCLDIAQ
jgi:hypothetical protein